MSDRAEPGGRIAFGVFEADLTTSELRRGGLSIRLPAQSFQVLRLLLSRPGELVSRQELQRALWPTDSFGDFEHGLNAAVNRLREALGDNAEAPHFVETLPRRGYRFIGSVDSRIAPSPSSHSPSPETSASPEPLSSDLPLPFEKTSRFAGRRRAAVLAGLAGLVALVIAIAVWQGHSSPSGAGVHHDYSVVQVTPLTALPGREFSPTFSPDGSHVAFAWDGGNADRTSAFDLYVKVVGSERVQQLTRHPAQYLVPAWSPDGRNIAFARVGTGVTGIFLVSALGGPERKLAEMPIQYGLTLALSWSPDGQILAFGSDDGVREVSVGDDSVRGIGTVPGCRSTGTGTPAFSPDGRWLAFSCYLDMSYDLEVMPVRGGAVRTLTRVNAIPSSLAWSADSTRVLYTQVGRLFAISREGGRPEILLFAHAATHPAVALRGDRLAYADARTNVNIWRMDLRPAAQGMASPTAPTSSLQYAPDISPDGTKLVFESERSGRHDVWMSNLDGSDATELGEFHTLTGSPRWSPDGRRIVFDSRESGIGGLYLVDPQEGVPRRIDIGSMGVQLPRWSRDGRRIYFNAIVPNITVSGGIYQVSPSGGMPQLVTATPGFNAQEDRSGRTLYFMAGDADAPIRALDLATGKESAVEGMPTVDTPTDWAVASKGIYFIDSAAKPATISLYEFASRRVTRRFPLARPPGYWGGIALASDESWLAYSLIDRDDSDLMLAEPFR